MIYLGTDIVDINRIRDTLKDNKIKFLDRIFTKAEVKYCNSKLDPAIHFAGRFAGKEAVKKALLSSGILYRISMKEIEILARNNIPEVHISSLSCAINISISHSEDLATATAILTNETSINNE